MRILLLLALGLLMACLTACPEDGGMKEGGEVAPPPPGAQVTEDGEGA